MHKDTTAFDIFSVEKCLRNAGFRIINIITWQKSDPTPTWGNLHFNFSSEYIIWAKKTPMANHYFNYELMKEINGGTQMRDVWTLPAIAKWEKSCGKHPTQKPLELLRRIILASTNKGDLILDPFTGSSTTGIIALELDRKFIGIDLEKEYLDLSVKRLEQIFSKKDKAWQ